MPDKQNKKEIIRMEIIFNFQFSIFNYKVWHKRNTPH